MVPEEPEQAAAAESEVRALLRLPVVEDPA